MATFDHDTEGIEVVKRFKKEVEGKTILITGASEGGIGDETAVSLAHANPAHLLLLARSEAKVAPVIAKVRDLNPSIKADFIPIQLDDFDSVRKAAAQVNSLITKLHVVINNAGIMAVTNYTTNKTNIESQFVTNHLGHFLLTALLYPKTEAAGQGARIINLSSHGHRAGPFRGDDYNFNAGADYNPWSGYGQAKTANILFSRQLATRLANRGIQTFAVHPGTIHGTTLGTHIPDLAESFADLYAVALRNTGEEFGEMDPPKSKQQGAATTLVTALDPSIADRTGTYWKDCHETEAAGYAMSLENAQKLWDLSEKLVGEKFAL